ncbi:ISL3 family transposase [Embleya sp. NPDC059259]|uniref:ISL3 family transposase n=1 Tax=unclassified Embleya TaxID=2699296 RepID=UPI0036A482EE
MEMSMSWWAGLLFPTAGVRVESVEVDVDEVRVRVRAASNAEYAACPGRGASSARVHDRYVRRLAHSTVAGRAVGVHLAVRRFVCADRGCPRRTFVEQIDGLTWRYGRRSRALRTVLERIALALAGRAGARLAVGLGVLVGAATLLRLIRALPEPELDHAPRVLGIDDFATRRGHVYATVLVDIEAHRVIDVLPDRTADTLAAWLDAHPGVEIACRDRAGAYAEAVRTAAPDAQQVADRWHLWHNLWEVVEKCVLAHRDHLVEPVDAESSEREPEVGRPVPGVVEGALWVRSRERYTAVQDLVAKGVGISAIGEALGLDRKTVRRFAHAACVEDVLTVHAARSRGTLRPYLGHLHQRWNEGCTDGAVLHAEIRDLGFRGGRRTVRRWLQPLRAAGRPAPRVVEAPTVRQVTRWLTRHPDSLAAEETLQLKRVLARSPELRYVSEAVREFVEMMRDRRGRELPDWIDRVAADGSPPLRGFAVNLRRDLDAVVAGPSLPWNSGPVEGAVTRIKYLKRQMFGRANFDLLRLRILNPN